MKTGKHTVANLSLDLSFDNPLYQTLCTLLRPPVEQFLALPRLRRVYERVQQTDGNTFFEQVLSAMNVDANIYQEELERIPEKGPVVVVANHPLGGIEGILLGALLTRRRSDVKILTNALLGRIPEMQEHGIMVNLFGGEQAARANRKAMKEALQWLRGGGMLAVFPAGEVAHFRYGTQRIEEGEWHSTIGRLISVSGASALPVFFGGSNGLFFHLAGMLHPRLRTALLAREFVNKHHRRIDVRVGHALSQRELGRLGTDRGVMDYLRERTLMLEHRDSTVASPSMRRASYIVQPTAPHLLAQEVMNLTPDHLLVECDDYVVYGARAEKIPHALHEIGRLREITFRQNGEGTGKSIDLDTFDRYYLHVFVWNKTKQEIVGAYRLGQSDIILRFFGKEGLYSSTLFTYNEQFLQEIQPALEMGRSFVRPEYQKAYQPLMLLWKGIGAFLRRNPQYKALFGPVSISNQYQLLSRRLIAEYLMNHHAFEKEVVTPLHPFATGEKRLRSLCCEELSEMIRDVECGQRTLPVLLKHYLKLGGKILGFNIDPRFNQALDALIFVDLTHTNPHILHRYMGAEGTASFLAFHGLCPGHRPAHRPALLAEHVPVHNSSPGGNSSHSIYISS